MVTVCFLNPQIISPWLLREKRFNHVWNLVAVEGLANGRVSVPFIYIVVTCKSLELRLTWTDFLQKYCLCRLQRHPHCRAQNNDKLMLPPVRSVNLSDSWQWHPWCAQCCWTWPLAEDIVVAGRWWEEERGQCQKVKKRGEIESVGV
jgi:hypothetical protein